MVAACMRLLLLVVHFVVVEDVGLHGHAEVLWHRPRVVSLVAADPGGDDGAEGRGHDGAGRPERVVRHLAEDVLQARFLGRLEVG